MRTLRKTFAAFGRDLACTIDRGGKKIKVSLVQMSELSRGSLADPKAETNLASLESVWNSKFTKSNLNKACLICGSESDVEMHHVRKIRDLRAQDSKLDFFTRQMAAINRKQIPLCKTHHQGLHNNS